MSQFARYAFILIALFLILSYYKGTFNIISGFSAGLNAIFKTLQGRNEDGSVAGYAK